MIAIYFYHNVANSDLKSNELTFIFRKDGVTGTGFALLHKKTDKENKRYETIIFKIFGIMQWRKVIPERQETIELHSCSSYFLKSFQYATQGREAHAQCHAVSLD